MFLHMDLNTSVKLLHHECADEEVTRVSLELGNSAAFGGILMRILGLSIQSLAFLLFMLHDFQFL